MPVTVKNGFLRLDPFSSASEVTRSPLKTPDYERLPTAFQLATLPRWSEPATKTTTLRPVYTRIKARLLYAKTQLAELYNFKKILKNLHSVRKNPTKDGINSVVSSIEASVWRVVGTLISAGTSAILTGEAMTGSVMVLLDLAIKAGGYLVADKAIQKLHNDEQIPLKTLLTKIGLWRAQGSAVSITGMSGLFPGNPELIFNFAVIDAAIKLPLHLGWALLMRKWAHEWKIRVIPEYAQKYQKVSA